MLCNFVDTDYLCKHVCAELKNFLLFVTGTKQMHVVDSIITITFQAGNSIYSSTCQQQLFLPTIKEYALFKQFLLAVTSSFSDCVSFTDV